MTLIDLIKLHYKTFCFYRIDQVVHTIVNFDVAVHGMHQINVDTMGGFAHIFACGQHLLQSFLRPKHLSLLSIIITTQNSHLLHIFVMITPIHGITVVQLSYRI